MRIVIVERDAALGLFLQKGLTLAGHEARWTDRTAEVPGLAEGGAPDLMVIDVQAEEGMDLLAEVHRLYRRTAVLAFTSNSVEDRIRCLDMGADDCLAKPFSFHELTARCRALLRRQERSGEIILQHGDLSLNRIRRTVSVGGRAVSLTVKEFRLLEFLMENTGRCCSRSELLAQVFDLPTGNGTNVVDVYINYLRKKIAEAEGSLVIVTVRGAGYRLVRSTGLAQEPLARRNAIA